MSAAPSVAKRIGMAAWDEAPEDLAMGDVRKAAEAVAPEWTGRGEVYPHLVRRCLQLARQYAVERRGRGESTATSEFSAYSRITATRILEQIEPTVRHLRYSYFHTRYRVSDPDAAGTRPPFDSYATAVEWLQQERWETRLRRLDKEDEARRDEITEELERLAGELEDLTGWVVEWEPRPYVTIHYEDTEGREYELWAGRHDSLCMFATWVYRLSLWAGFDQSDLVRYILCGTTPTLPRATIKLEPPIRGTLLDKTKIEREQVVVVLRTPDLDYQGQRQLSETIREAWRHSRTAVPTGPVRDKDGLLYEIIAGLGGADRQGQPYGFWPKVKTRWVAAGEKDMTTKALIKRWKKIKGRVPGAGGGKRARKNRTKKGER